MGARLQEAPQHNPYEWQCLNIDTGACKSTPIAGHVDVHKSVPSDAFCEHRWRAMMQFVDKIPSLQCLLRRL